MKKKHSKTSDGVVRIAVASDLHAYAVDKSRPSHLNVREAASFPGQHPITGLLKLIKEEGITADALLCPGDLGDKACAEGVTYAWSALHEVKVALKAKMLAATAWAAFHLSVETTGRQTDGSTG